jgi:hypothetical protein
MSWAIQQDYFDKVYPSKRKEVRKMAEKEKEEPKHAAAPAAAPAEKDEPHHKYPKPSKETAQAADEAREQLLKRREEQVKAGNEAAASPAEALKARRKKESEEYEAAVKSAPVVAPWENPTAGTPRVEVPIEPTATGIPQQVSR